MDRYGVVSNNKLMEHCREHLLKGREASRQVKQQSQQQWVAILKYHAEEDERKFKNSQDRLKEALKEQDQVEVVLNL